MNDDYGRRFCYPYLQLSSSRTLSRTGQCFPDVILDPPWLPNARGRIRTRSHLACLELGHQVTPRAFICVLLDSDCCSRGGSTVALLIPAGCRGCYLRIMVIQLVLFHLHQAHPAQTLACAAGIQRDPYPSQSPALKHHFVASDRALSHARYRAVGFASAALKILLSLRRHSRQLTHH